MIINRILNLEFAEIVCCEIKDTKPQPFHNIRLSYIDQPSNILFV